MRKQTAVITTLLLALLLFFFWLFTQTGVLDDMTEFFVFFAFAGGVILAVYVVNRLYSYLRAKRTGQPPDYTLPEDREGEDRN